MKKISIVCLAFVLAITFGFANAYAQSSSKATSQTTDINVLGLASASAGDGYSTIFTSVVKTPQDKELFIDVSLECGLTTDTTVMSKQLAKALANANAMVMVRVLVDGIPAAPGEVVFARRNQTLIAEFAGFIPEECYTINEDLEGNHTVTIDPECVQQETLQLILDTMSANSFNFIASDLSSDEHTVEVQAKLTYDTYTDTVLYSGAEAAATAYLGKGSVTVETVRMIKGEVVDLTTQQ